MSASILLCRSRRRWRWFGRRSQPNEGIGSQQRGCNKAFQERQGLLEVFFPGVLQSRGGENFNSFIDHSCQTLSLDVYTSVLCNEFIIRRMYRASKCVDLQNAYCVRAPDKISSQLQEIVLMPSCMQNARLSDRSRVRASFLHGLRFLWGLQGARLSFERFKMRDGRVIVINTMEGQVQLDAFRDFLGSALQVQLEASCSARLPQSFMQTMACYTWSETAYLTLSHGNKSRHTCRREAHGTQFWDSTMRNVFRSYVCV